MQILLLLDVLQSGFLKLLAVGISVLRFGSTVFVFCGRVVKIINFPRMAEPMLLALQEMQISSSARKVYSSKANIVECQQFWLGKTKPIHLSWVQLPLRPAATGITCGRSAN